jgi:hypothetical protein
MRTRSLAGIASAAVIAALVAVPVGAANAATPQNRAAHTSAPVWIRQSDFISALSDTRSSGHFQFIQDGLHLWTDDSTGNAKVAEYFPLSGTLASMEGSTPGEWWGTDPGPGAQIVFDADGTRGANAYNILVGEWAYAHGTDPSTYDWWLTNGSSTLAHSVCPLTGGGSGTNCHGTLTQWAAALPQAKVYAGGFSLGSGVLGNGLLYSQTYGSTTYRFTSAPSVLTSSIALAPRIVVTGQLVTATGSLRRDGFAVAGQPVTLSYSSGHSWVVFGRVTTDANGNWRKLLIPRATWTIRATAAGYPSATAVIIVRSKVDVLITGRSVAVGVVPNLSGKKVALQRKQGTAWVTKAYATLSRTSTTIVRAPQAGVYRVVAPAVTGFAPGISRSFWVS